MTKLLIHVGALAAAAILAGGCANTHKPLDPGKINHVVLFNLKDPSLSSELEQDCAKHLQEIPSVRTYACGPHYDIGRENIDSDYMLGLLVSFDDEAGYKAYLEHPGHVTLVEKWKPEFANVTIYDIGNDPSSE